MRRISICIIVLLLLFVLVAFAGDNEHHSTGEKIALYLSERNIPPELIVILISTLPIVELRGAIPVAIGLFDMNLFIAYVLCVVGNMIPVIPLLLLLGPLSRLLMKTKIGKRFFDWFFERTRRRIGGNIEKYETLGLSIFVAIPLPVTGAWTGCAGAFLFAIPFKKAFWAVLLGVMVAGVIMTILSVLGWIGALIAGLALIALLVKTILIMFNSNEKQETIINEEHK